jgi:DNA-binding MarR family transcriptional regulator
LYQQPQRQFGCLAKFFLKDKAGGLSLDCSALNMTRSHILMHLGEAGGLSLDCSALNMTRSHILMHLGKHPLQKNQNIPVTMSAISESGLLSASLITVAWSFVRIFLSNFSRFTLRILRLRLLRILFAIC